MMTWNPYLMITHLVVAQMGHINVIIHIDLIAEAGEIREITGDQAIPVEVPIIINSPEDTRTMIEAAKAVEAAIPKIGGQARPETVQA